MKLKFALVGLAALGAVFGGAALTAGPASAMPIGVASGAGVNSNVEQVRLVCNRWGRCWRTGPVYVRPYGYGYGYRRPYYRGYYRRW
jgi:hypothetical protein